MNIGCIHAGVLLLPGIIGTYGLSFGNFIYCYGIWMVNVSLPRHFGCWKTEIRKKYACSGFKDCRGMRSK